MVSSVDLQRRRAQERVEDITAGTAAFPTSMMRRALGASRNISEAEARAYENVLSVLYRRGFFDNHGVKKAQEGLIAAFRPHTEEETKKAASDEEVENDLKTPGRLQAVAARDSNVADAFTQFRTAGAQMVLANIAEIITSSMPSSLQSRGHTAAILGELAAILGQQERAILLTLMNEPAYTIPALHALSDARDEKDLEAIAPYLSNESSRVRMAAMDAVSHIGGKGTGLLLIKALENEVLRTERDESVITFGIARLGAYTSDEAVFNFLQGLLAESNDPLRLSAAAGALQKSSRMPEAAVAMLACVQRMIKRGDWETADRMVEAANLALLRYVKQSINQKTYAQNPEGLLTARDALNAFFESNEVLAMYGARTPPDEYNKLEKTRQILNNFFMSEEGSALQRHVDMRNAA